VDVLSMLIKMKKNIKLETPLSFCLVDFYIKF